MQSIYETELQEKDELENDCIALRVEEQEVIYTLA